MEIEKKICRSFSYRHTIKTNALTLHFIILDGEILEPNDVRRSRTGAHGEDIYCLTEDEWNRAIIITFNRSNTGRTSVHCINLNEDICRMLHNAWIVEDIETALQLITRKVWGKT